ncbi:hypothetical protein EVAR_15011_1 [Eumeta japonica]|uniref:Uncharacterized protein n=1 Tax=Eumeta variegata TaxID=151549 RepID=A0A4C1X7I4_EUMVA|nr:hypothetical protein EVAR_15011_1 [Eumeta japonica]
MKQCHSSEQKFQKGYIVGPDSDLRISGGRSAARRAADHPPFRRTGSRATVTSWRGNVGRACGPAIRPRSPPAPAAFPTAVYVRYQISPTEMAWKNTQSSPSPPAPWSWCMCAPPAPWLTSCCMLRLQTTYTSNECRVWSARPSTATGRGLRVTNEALRPRRAASAILS